MCIRNCEPRDAERAHKQGWRNLIIFPRGGYYRGYWQKSEHHHYGEKKYSSGLIYRGFFSKGKRHGQGELSYKHENGDVELIYIGQFENDVKSGEGKQFYKDGVYYGFFKQNLRDGLGFFWRNDGCIRYIGEWQGDQKHGSGVYFCDNGNRYEGNFAHGYKNGEGTFYHNSSGQIQKGIWDNDVCRTSMMLDEFRGQVTHPTPYPIPPLLKADADSFIRKLFRQHLQNGNRAARPYMEAWCLNMIHKWKHWIKLQPSGTLNSQICLGDLCFPCVCTKIDVTPVLFSSNFESHECFAKTCKKPLPHHYCFEGEKLRLKSKLFAKK